MLTEHSAVSAKTEIYPVNSVIEQQGPGQKIKFGIILRQIPLLKSFPHPGIFNGIGKKRKHFHHF